MSNLLSKETPARPDALRAAAEKLATDAITRTTLREARAAYNAAWDLSNAAYALDGRETLAHQTVMATAGSYLIAAAL